VQEDHKCPVEDCGKVFKAPKALREHVRLKHQESPEKGEPRAQARKVPIVEEDFATAELIRGKGMDIAGATSYEVLSNLDLRRLKVAGTLPPPGHNVLHSPIKIAKVHNLILHHTTY